MGKRIGIKSEGNYNEFIYNQKDIPKNRWRYGFRSSAATGCGWIATHNALRLMGYPSNPQNLIRYYEWHFPFINGNFGTFILNIVFFFRQKKFKVKLLVSSEKFDDAARKSDVCILFYGWHEKYKFGLHYVAVQYDKNRFWGYNTYSNSIKPDNLGNSLQKFLKQKRYFRAFLITIGDKRSCE